jgi:hypothetical protein
LLHQALGKAAFWTSFCLTGTRMRPNSCPKVSFSFFSFFLASSLLFFWLFLFAAELNPKVKAALTKPLTLSITFKDYIFKGPKQVYNYFGEAVGLRILHSYVFVFSLLSPFAVLCLCSLSYFFAFVLFSLDSFVRQGIFVEALLLLRLILLRTSRTSLIGLKKWACQLCLMM